MKQTRKQMVDAIKKHSPRYTAYKISVAEVKKLYDEGIRLRLIKEIKPIKGVGNCEIDECYGTGYYRHFHNKFLCRKHHRQLTIDN